MGLLGFFFQIIGFCLFVYMFTRFLVWFFNTFIYSSRFKIGRYVGTGKWAVVTGCTSGIGEGFAIELARRKSNVVLMSRSQEKLNDLAASLEKRFGIDTKVIVVDFADLDISDPMEELGVFIRDKKVTCIVNNVGMATKLPELFVNHTVKNLEDFMMVNCLSALKLTKVVLPHMEKQKNGLIFNLSSFSGVIAVPMLSVYCATKHFMKGWGEALAEEVRGKGIRVTNLTPMFIKSNMTGFRRTTLRVPSGEKFARVSLNRVGGWFDEVTINPYFYHSAESWVYRLIPHSYRNEMLFKGMIKTRKAVLRKMEREKQKKN